VQVVLYLLAPIYSCVLARTHFYSRDYFANFLLLKVLNFESYLFLFTLHNKNLVRNKVCKCLCEKL